MATKTFRTIYLSDDLDERILKIAKQENSSVSKLVRVALQNHMKNMECIDKTHNSENIKKVSGI